MEKLSFPRDIFDYLRRNSILISKYHKASTNITIFSHRKIDKGCGNVDILFCNSKYVVDASFIQIQCVSTIYTSIKHYMCASYQYALKKTKLISYAHRTFVFVMLGMQNKFHTGDVIHNKDRGVEVEVERDRGRE